MDSKLSEQVLLFSMNKLEKTKIVPMFEALIISGEIWLMSDEMLDTAALLIESGQVGLKAKERKVRGMDA